MNVNESCPFGVERAMEGMVDRVEHAFAIIAYFAVPETQDTEALTLEPVLALLVFARNIVATVMPAVELDNEPRRKAREISDIGADRHLFSKVRRLDGHSLEGAPELAFGFRRVGAQTFGCLTTKGGEAAGGVTPPRRLRRRPSPSRGGWTLRAAHQPRPIRRALSASCHQMAGTPRSYFGTAAGRPNWSQ